MSTIKQSTKVRVTGASSTEQGTEGTVKTIRRGWTGKEAVVVVSDGVRTREVSIPVSDLSEQ